MKKTVGFGKGFALENLERHITGIGLPSIKERAILPDWWNTVHRSALCQSTVGDPTKVISVLIADDHVLFRQGLLSLLDIEEDIAVVGECGDGNTAMEMIVRFRPDVAVLDISMPVVGGIELAEEIARRGLSTRIVILTMYKGPTVVCSAFNAGVSAYVLKDDAFDCVVHAIRAVAARGTFISDSLASNLPDPYLAADCCHLTHREREIMSLIARGQTSKEISESLFISPKTVETHRKNIMIKLGLHSVAELVRYAIESSLI
jgi:DNA-binding NarL/FixJ family response regulator